MAANREMLTGTMNPVSDPERTAATRRAFLLSMLAVMVATAGHLAYAVGVHFGETIGRL